MCENILFHVGSKHQPWALSLNCISTFNHILLTFCSDVPYRNFVAAQAAVTEELIPFLFFFFFDCAFDFFGSLFLAKGSSRCNHYLTMAQLLLHASMRSTIITVIRSAFADTTMRGGLVQFALFLSDHDIEAVCI